MKKFVLLILILFLTGCSDYKEINDLAIVDAIAIDYEDNFIINLSIIKNANDALESYNVTGSASTINEAILDAANHLSKIPFYSQLKVMILSENVLKGHLNEIIEYFLRSTYFKENFICIATSNNAADLLNLDISNNTPGNALKGIIESNDYEKSANKNFKTLASEITSFGIDASLPIVDIVNNTYKLNGMYSFDGYQLKNALNNSDIETYSILKGNSPKYTLDYVTDEKTFSVILYDGLPNYEFKSNTINITGSYKAKIINNELNLNINDEKIVENINNALSNILNEKIDIFLKQLQNDNTDILGISSKYYKSTRIKNASYFKNSLISTNMKVQITKKGLINNLNEEN